ncbi:MAG TPA: glutamate--tRNA ligase [Nitrososphaerales archaeon]|nr:glutamate--tRNA ligase [Nitrososphaerales archaeon]
MSDRVEDDKQIGRLARKYALLNAIQHNSRADQNSVIGRILSENSELRKEAKRVRTIVLEETQRVNSLSREDQSRAIKEEFPGFLEEDASRRREVSKQDATKVPELPDLPNASPGQVVTRFPPEPNGFMHIGHAKAAIIGSQYARRYEGKFILRFDDTNPAAEKEEYYGAFLEALEWLEIKPDLIKNASDDMPRFYELAERMIARGKAFVCTCTQEKMRENRSLMLECACRSRSVEENKNLWQKMIKGGLGPNSTTLRFVGDMKSVNTTLRDPVLFRIVEEAHPMKGRQFNVWPTYDFDGPIEDSLDGVTHAMRSKEYELRDELYRAILNSLDLRVPQIIEFSRLSLRNTTVSKRNLRKLIESGDVKGWDDPRLPTISGLRRRGILPQTIREFILQMGVSKVESEPTWDMLESINRKFLDPVAKRFFFVPNPVPLIVRNAPSKEVRLKYHPDRPMGERIVATSGQFLIPRDDASALKPESIFRLIEAYNVKVESVSPQEVIGTYVPDSSIVGVPKFQWVPREGKVELKVLVPGALLIHDTFNPDSLTTIAGVSEPEVDRLRAGEIVQFVRVGFCRIDEKGIAILSHK